MYNQSLKNKVLIVTGGSGGIGSAIIKKLSQHGARIISIYNQNPPAGNSDKNIFWRQADLTKSEDWDNLLLYTLKNFKKIDIMINSVGYLEPGEFSSIKANQLTKMIDLNFSYVLIGIHKTLAIMNEQRFGHIINIGSLGGIVPMPYSAVYSATKFALRGFSFSLAEELKVTGLNISLITPGSVVTKMLNSEAMNESCSISFLSKPISPVNVADAVLKVINKPRVELLIPRSQSFPSKLLVFSPGLYSKLYKILHRIGITKKRRYLDKYCNITV